MHSCSLAGWSKHYLARQNLRQKPSILPYCSGVSGCRFSGGCGFRDGQLYNITDVEGTKFVISLVVVVPEQLVEQFTADAKLDLLAIDIVGRDFEVEKIRIKHIVASIQQNGIVIFEVQPVVVGAADENLSISAGSLDFHRTVQSLDIIAYGYTFQCNFLVL
ncbi:hypothetical protein Tsp_01362 [Trichinella spiralis]|uniref:hypothetical protein n=1 Tax=Trichinella spiralis TaxID=6334 RepID=UPI0001EFD070|nr:hypothetical protein Tsp_01362 [Trichinella spiralis]